MANVELSGRPQRMSDQQQPSNLVNTRINDGISSNFSNDRVSFIMSNPLFLFEKLALTFICDLCCRIRRAMCVSKVWLCRVGFVGPPTMSASTPVSILSPSASKT